MQSLIIRQTAQMVNEAMHKIVYGRLLLIGTDDVLCLTPQRVHGIQLRRSFRKPQQRNVHLRGKGLRSKGRVTGIFIQQKCYMPPAVMPLEHMQKSPEVFTSLSLPDQKKAGACFEINGSKDYPFRIISLKKNFCRLSSQRPRGTKRRKQQKIGFILKQQDTAGRQFFDLADDSSFFSPDRDQGQARTVDVSTQTLNAESPGVRLQLKDSVLRSAPNTPVKGEPSNSWQRVQTARERRPTAFLQGSPSLHHRAGDDLSETHIQEHGDDESCNRYQSSYKYSCGLLQASERSQEWSFPYQVPISPVYVGNDVHPECGAIRIVDGNADMELRACCS